MVNARYIFKLASLYDAIDFRLAAVWRKFSGVFTR